MPGSPLIRSTRARLFLLSFTLLFVELALIRWTGANIVDLSFFTNFVLLGSFLGIGVGFLQARARFDLLPWAPVALLLVVALVLMFPTEIDSAGGELVFIGGRKSGLPIWVTLPIVFAASAAVMTTIAQGLARAFMQFDPLRAYSIDVLGSLAGIGAFSALSLLGLPSVAWGVVAAAMLLLLSNRPRPVHLVACAALVLLLGVESTRPGVSWSPYYKIHTVTLKTPEYPVPTDQTMVFANQIPIQEIEDIGPVIPASGPRPGATHQELRRYFDEKPYRHLTTRPRTVLVIGAGNGYDTAIALAEGAQHVDAVEIDPRILELGRELNPNRPYSDPRVQTITDDGRAFLERTGRRYDLVIFAATDSQTLLSGQSSLRLESYLYTREAMDAVRAHLTPDGAFAAYNYYAQDWVVDRLANMLKQTYGHDPCVDVTGSAGRLASITVDMRQANQVCTAPWKPSSLPIPPPATDDHPFPYLRTATIPGFYLLTLGLILVASVVVVRMAAGPPGPMLPYADLFFMGSAFLLLETKNIVQFALLFGVTWWVNALVFAGILSTVYAAVQLARRVRIGRPELLYALLFLALAVAWAIPQHLLLHLDAVPRFAAATILAFTPIFLANLVFAERFREVGEANIAFGANLLGAMVGGVLEYLSLVLGFSNLLIIVALIYGLALVAGRRVWRVPVGGA